MKFYSVRRPATQPVVTRLVGVWIEILQEQGLFEDFVVTPLVGVWIEIADDDVFFESERVTPLVGVWIEIT